MAKKTIKIRIGKYQGSFKLSNSQNKEVTLVQSASGYLEANVKPGKFNLDTGPRIGGSSIHFEVSKAGNIKNVSPSDSAVPNGNTVELKLAKIEICTAAYEGEFDTSLNAGVVIDASNVDHFETVAIVDQYFKIDNRASVLGSSILAITRKDGSVDSLNPESTDKCGGHISFRTSELTIVTGKQAQNLSGYGNISAEKSYTLIRGLMTSLTTHDGTVIRFVPH